MEGRQPFVRSSSVVNMACLRQCSSKSNECTGRNRAVRRLDQLPIPIRSGTRCSFDELSTLSFCKCGACRLGKARNRRQVRNVAGHELNVIVLEIQHDQAVWPTDNIRRELLIDNRELLAESGNDKIGRVFYALPDLLPLERDVLFEQPPSQPYEYQQRYDCNAGDEGDEIARRSRRTDGQRHIRRSLHAKGGGSVRSLCCLCEGRWLGPCPVQRQEILHLPHFWPRTNAVGRERHLASRCVETPTDDGPHVDV